MRQGRQGRQGRKFNYTPSIWTTLLPLKAIDRLREKMHERLTQLSPRCYQITADNSSHFVWTDEPEVIVRAIEQLISSC